MAETTEDLKAVLEKTLPEGVKTVAMAAPFVGIPVLAAHALSGVVVGGLGLAPLLLASGFVATRFLPEGLNLGDLIKKINPEPAKQESTPVSES